MKFKPTITSCLTTIALFCSCHDDVYIVNNGSGSSGDSEYELTDVTLSLTPVIFDEGVSQELDLATRTLAYEFSYGTASSRGTITALWDTLNSVGIFPIAPESNAQVKYTFHGERVSKVHTNYHGQGWNLKPDNTYASYYPYMDFTNSQSPGDIPIVFHDQKQTYNNNTDHLDGINNVYYATAHRPDKEDSITFIYKRAAGILWVRIIAPELDAAVGRLTIASNDGQKIFTDSATVNVATGELTRITTSDRTVLHFDKLWNRVNEKGQWHDKEIHAGDTINLFLTMAPIGTTDAESNFGTLVFELCTSTKAYYSFWNGAKAPTANNGSWFTIHPSTAKRTYIDLGLPSGTLWGDCNLGALVPTDPGYYYAWGETLPAVGYFWTSYSLNMKDESYSDNDRRSSTGSYLQKYTIPDRQYYGCWYDEHRNFCGDGLKVLLPEDDAAVYQLGSYDKGSWDMPTREQYLELLDYCELSWTTNYRESGRNGYLCTSKVNGNSIFFPAAGYMGMENETDDVEGQLTDTDDDGIIFQEGARGLNSDGYYWTRSLSDSYSTDAYEFKFNTYMSNNSTKESDRVTPTPNIATTKRYVGQSIRPVFHPKK